MNAPTYCEFRFEIGPEFETCGEPMVGHYDVDGTVQRLCADCRDWTKRNSGLPVRELSQGELAEMWGK